MATDIGEGAFLGEGATCAGDGVSTRMSLGVLIVVATGERYALAVEDLRAPYGIFQFMKLAHQIISLLLRSCSLWRVAYTKLPN
jgi:hypothetical protein